MKSIFCCFKTSLSKGRQVRSQTAQPPSENITTPAEDHTHHHGYLIQADRPINYEEDNATPPIPDRSPLRLIPPPIPERSPLRRMAGVGDNQTKTKYKGVFDIVESYQRILRDDAELTMPLAAIEALIELLSVTDAVTVFETLDLIKTQSALLKSKIPNSISLTAGLDLFRQFIMASLKPTSDFSGNFEAIRNHLVTNGKTFIDRAKTARQSIANCGQHFIRDGNIIMTHGGSRVVGALLTTAASPDRPRGNIRFNVIYVMNEARKRESDEIVASLRAKGIPVAEIPESAVAYCMNTVDKVIVGAEGVVENGGIISRLGTFQLALIAHAHEKQFLVAAESHKFVRLFPLGQDDLGVEQNIIQFKEAGDSRDPDGLLATAVDYTHPKYISAIVTETGVKTTSAITEELCYIHHS